MALHERFTLGMRFALVLVILALSFAGVVYLTYLDAESMKVQVQADIDRKSTEHNLQLSQWYDAVVREHARQLAAPFLWNVETLEGVEEGSPAAQRIQRRMWQFVYGRDSQPAHEDPVVGPLESVVVIDRAHRIVAASDPMAIDKRFTDPEEIERLDMAMNTPQVHRDVTTVRGDGRTVTELSVGVPNSRGEMIGVVKMRYVGGEISAVPSLPRYEVPTKPSFFGPVLAGFVAILGVGFGGLATAQVISLARRIEAMARGVPLAPTTRGPGARALSVIEGKLGILSDAMRRDDAMVTSLSEALQEGVVLLDATGKLVIATSLASRMLEIDEGGDAGARSGFEAVLDACPELTGIVVEALDHGKASKEKPMALRLPGGSTRLVQVTSYVVHDGRRTAQIVLLLKDRPTIQVLERNLREASRLQAIARLTGSVAHEVRNPLGAVGIHLENLRRQLTRRGDPDPSVEEKLRVVTAEIDRVCQIMEEWLRFTAPEERAAENANVREVLDSVSRLLRVEARHQEVVLEVGSEGDPGEVPLSTARLQQVILNLALNALQAMPNGGRLELRAAERGDRVELKVIDTGCGIPPEVQDKVYDFHFTTRPDGSGLGLPISRRMVDEAGGEMNFESRAGDGTTFTIILPRQQISRDRSNEPSVA